MHQAEKQHGHPPAHTPTSGRLTRLVFLLILPLFLAGCGGGSSDGGTATTTVTGTASKGPISGAEIHLYVAYLDGGISGDPVAGPITTNADGTWNAEVADDLPRPLVVVATGGTYVDEATGATVDLDGRSLRSYLPAGATTAAVTPLTELLVQMTQEEIANGVDVAIEDALANAQVTLASVLGIDFDPLTTQPLAIEAAGDGDRDQRTYTAILAGLSELANGLDPNADPFDLVAALMEDLSDGLIDGQKNGEPVAVGETTLLTLDPNLDGGDLVTAINDAITGEDGFEDLSFTDDGNGNLVVTPLYAVGGTVSGLAGSGLVLQNNNTDDLTITDNGDFRFATYLAEGEAYSITVLTQPSNLSQACAVTGGAGTLGAADLTTVTVACTTDSFTVGGTVTGLTEDGLILRNGTDEVTLNSGATAFTFPTAVTDGDAYNVTIASQPANDLLCVVDNASGTLAGADVTAVAVDCTRLGIGAITGGTGVIGTLTGQIDGNTITLTITPDAGYAILDVTAYLTADPGTTCTVTPVDGNLYTVDLSGGACTVDITFEESTVTYSVNVDVSGLAGSGLVLQNNGGDDLAIGTDGSFSFATDLAENAAYDVTVLTQPGGPQQLCRFDGTASGTATADVNLSLSCGLAYHLLSATWGIEAASGTGTLVGGFLQPGMAMADTINGQLVLTDTCEVFSYFDTRSPANSSTVVADYGCLEADEPIPAVFATDGITANLPEESEGGVTEAAWSLAMERVGSAGTTLGLPDAAMGLAISTASGTGFEAVSVNQAFLARKSDGATIGDLAGDWGVVRLELVNFEPGLEVNYSVLSFGATISDTGAEGDGEGTFASLGDEVEADLQQFVDGTPVVKSEFFAQRTDELFDLPISVATDGAVNLTIAGEGGDPDQRIDGFMDPAGNLLVLATGLPSIGDVRADTVPAGTGETVHELLVGLRRGNAADLNGRTYRLVGPGFFVGQYDFEINRWETGSQIAFSEGNATITLRDTFWTVPFANFGEGGIYEETAALETLPPLSYTVGGSGTTRAGMIEIDISDVVAPGEGFLTGYVQAGGQLLVLGLGTTDVTEDEPPVMEGGSINLIFGVCVSGC